MRTSYIIKQQKLSKTSCIFCLKKKFNFQNQNLYSIFWEQVKAQNVKTDGSQSYNEPEAKLFMNTKISVDLLIIGIINHFQTKKIQNLSRIRKVQNIIFGACGSRFDNHFDILYSICKCNEVRVKMQK